MCLAHYAVVVCAGHDRHRRLAAERVPDSRKNAYDACTSCEAFFGGTYFAPAQLRLLLQKISELWEKEQSALTSLGSRIELEMRSIGLHAAASAPVDDIMKNAVVLGFEALENSFDSIFGGFGESQKFPMPSHLAFLLTLCQFGKLVEGNLDRFGISLDIAVPDGFKEHGSRYAQRGIEMLTKTLDVRACCHLRGCLKAAFMTTWG